MLRRNFIKLLVGAVLGALSGAPARARSGPYSFDHGVASGDPGRDRVILWTRISGGSGEEVTVDWSVAADADMRRILASGRVTTGPARDYTVKVDAAGIPAGARLYYRFRVGSLHSALGRTRTLPLGPVASARFAVVSCSNYAAGFFHAYREIGERDDLDAVIHLGDYIYEHGLGGYATEMSERLGRVPDPPTEILTLPDYRRRHAQYKSDRDSQRMLAAHPLIAVWDDHEVANDAWMGGAENHGNDPDSDEGDWAARKANALQAYFEWMPVRGEYVSGPPRIFRDFEYGDLLRLIMLDTRLYGREKQPDIGDTDGSRASIDALRNGRKRQLLGPRQQRWLRKRMRTAATTWQVVAQQVLVAPFDTPDLEPVLDLEKPSMVPAEELLPLIARSKTNPPAVLDTWDGYPWARQALLRDIRRHGRNTVILSGDLHTPIAANLYLDGEDLPVAVEFMPSSVTSPGFADYLPERRPGGLRSAALRQNPGLRYLETGRRGWLCMTFTAERCLGQWHHFDTVMKPDQQSVVDRQMFVRAGQIRDGLQNA